MTKTQQQFSFVHFVVDDPVSRLPNTTQNSLGHQKYDIAHKQGQRERERQQRGIDLGNSLKDIDNKTVQRSRGLHPLFTYAIITRGLYIFYPSFHCGLYCREAYNAEWLIFHDSFFFHQTFDSFHLCLFDFPFIYQFQF